MTCDKLQDLLSPYLDGELDAAARAEVEGHCAACPGCADLLSRLSAAVEAFAGFPEAEPSPALLARLAAIPERPGLYRRALDFFLKPALQPVLAAATGFLMLFSVYMVSPDKALINRTISQQLHRGIGSIETLYVKAGSLTDRIGDFATNVFASAKNLNPVRKGED